MRRFPLPLVLVAVAVLAPAARGDEVIAPAPSATPLAAYGGDVAWWAPGDGGYRLMIHRGDFTSVAARVVVARPVPLTAGPDAAGRTAFLFSECGAGAPTTCRVKRYVPRTGRVEKLGLPADTTWAAQWRDRVAYVRGVHAKGSEVRTASCDVPYVKPVTGRSRKLDRGRCGQITSLALRGTDVAMTVDSAAIRTGDPRFTSQLRRLSARGGAVKVLETVNSGEESNHYGGAALTGDAIFATHFGLRPKAAFVRVDRAREKVSEVQSHIGLVGSLAVDAGSWAYLVGGAESTYTECSPEIPCRVVTAKNPFAAGEHALPPRLTLRQSSQAPKWSDAFVLSGQLTRTLVDRGAVDQTEPVPNVPIRLYRPRFNALSQLSGAEATGYGTTTGADGRWAITIPPPLPTHPFFSPVAATEGAPTTVFQFSAGSTMAGITLSATPATGGSVTFSGTVAPAQPGRTVEIKQTPSSAGGKAKTIATAPLTGDGTTFSVTAPVSGPMTVVATLPFPALDDDTGYGGSSPGVSVG